MNLDSPTPTVDTLTWAPPTAPPPTPPDRPPQRSRRSAIAAAATVALLVGAGAGGIAGAVSGGGNRTGTPKSTTLASTAAGVGPVADVSNLVATTLPSIVSIQVSSATQEAAGSGFVLTATGNIVTNAHVVNGFTTINVTLDDGTSHPGTVLGMDKTDDLAVVHIDASGLTPVTLGSSTGLRVGQPLVALGNALALTGGPSATEGIVSALGRSITTDEGENLTHLIQTDAAINPGNSGGPLLSLDGTVVGINSAGASGAQSVGFAIAIDEAKPIITELAAGQTVTAPFIGVSSGPVDPTVATQRGLRVDHGLLVATVQPGSPAAAAGLQVDDVIVTANNKPTNASDDLHTIIQDTGVGHPLVLNVVRGSGTVTVTITVGGHTA